MWGWLTILVILLVLAIVPFVFWIKKIISLSKNEDKTGMWVVLACGLFLSPLVGWLIGLAFKEDKPEELEKEKYFWCGICNVKYEKEFFGGETVHEGKICRSCLGKKQKGEAPVYSEQINREPTPREAIYDYQKSFQRKGKEKNILSRELGRKQRKKNSYLTQFIINLAVGQWLLPLITYLIYWIQLKEQMKVQALNNPGAGLPTEIPFKTVIKDFFKILTSETYVYGAYNVQISLLWKLGIILAFLLPLGFWIYNLVRFLSVNGEIKQLEAEIKELA